MLEQVNRLRYKIGAWLHGRWWAKLLLAMVLAMPLLFLYHLWWEQATKWRHEQRQEVQQNK